MLPRFNVMDVASFKCGSARFFIPTTLQDFYEIVRIRHSEEGPLEQQVFTNRRCKEGQVLPVFSGPSSEYMDARAFEIHDPQRGCVVLTLLHFFELRKREDWPALQKEIVLHRGYTAFVFDGTEWQPWRRPHDVDIEDGVDSGIELRVTSGAGQPIVSADSYKDTWFLLNTGHILDYSVGRCSLSDLLALDEEWRKRDKDDKKTRKLEEALELAKKLKGAVRAPTAARIVDLLESALYPF